MLVAKTRSPRSRVGGFTLLEIMFTISLIAILVGVSVVSYRPDSPAKQMKRAVVEIEALSARGHTMSLLHQKPFWLRFEQYRVVLEGAELETVNAGNPVGFEQEDDLTGLPDGGDSPLVEYDEFVFSEGMDVLIRRWGDAPQAWFHQQKETDPVIYWSFASSGLCEPISIRLELGGGVCDTPPRRDVDPNSKFGRRIRNDARRLKLSQGYSSNSRSPSSSAISSSSFSSTTPFAPRPLNSMRLRACRSIEPMSAVQTASFSSRVAGWC